MTVHPFDRYGQFTDLNALKAASDRSLRKSLRVNTLKTSIEDFKAWAAQEHWKIQPVPWAPEGYFIDRDDMSVALGKDLLHLLGHTYMQEASSMLPVALLDPQPGEAVLDMSAAPGSKTTQIAARMQNRGVVVANDVQEKRLWTLKTALHRCGVVNYQMTKKVGQWFGKHMNGRFDRVLCDAPCTAQGTARKDSDALDFSSDESIEKMERLQRDLLEAAVHSAKVGGRIVYSTCTLTPEENESVVRFILNKFSEQLTVVDPRTLFTEWDPTQAIQDSYVVQKAVFGEELFPVLRIWPQTYDTEGFFCAVLQKNAATREREHFTTLHFQERPLKRVEQKAVDESLKKIYGTSFMHEGEQLWERGDQMLLSSGGVLDFELPLENYSLGLPYAKGLSGSRFRITHELATARGSMATEEVLEVNDEQLQLLLTGKDAPCDPTLHGDIIIRWKNLNVGLALAKEGILKNRLSRWLVQHRSEIS